MIHKERTEKSVIDALKPLRDLNGEALTFKAQFGPGLSLERHQEEPSTCFCSAVDFRGYTRELGDAFLCRVEILQVWSPGDRDFILDALAALGLVGMKPIELLIVHQFARTRPDIGENLARYMACSPLYALAEVAEPTEESKFTAVVSSSVCEHERVTFSRTPLIGIKRGDLIAAKNIKCPI